MCATTEAGHRRHIEQDVFMVILKIEMPNLIGGGYESFQNGIGVSSELIIAGCCGYSTRKQNL